MNAHRWTPENRDALLARVGVVTGGTAVAACVGAVGLAVGFAATAQAATTHKASRTATTSPRSSTTTPSSAGSGSSSTVAPARVQVEVLNGVGIAGAAHLVADQLRSEGFDVVGVGNAQRIMPQSGIVYAPGAEAEYRTLARATGVTLSSAQGTGSALILVIGQDWQGSLPAPQSAPQAAPQGGGVVTSGGS